MGTKKILIEIELTTCNTNVELLNMRTCSPPGTLWWCPPTGRIDRLYQWIPIHGMQTKRNDHKIKIFCQSNNKINKTKKLNKEKRKHNRLPSFESVSFKSHSYRVVPTSATWKGCDMNLWAFLARATVNLSSSLNSSIPGWGGGERNRWEEVYR